MAEWMPGALIKPISYGDDAGNFVGTPLGWVLHVQAGNGGLFNYFNGLKSPSRKFSHFWVSKKGQIEQYRRKSGKCWAAGAGNSQYWHVETEGLPNEPLTKEQISALVKIHNFLGAPNKIASAPGQAGIGVHYMGGAAWGGHTCPDSSPGAGPRSKQRADIIRLAAGVTPVTPPVPPVIVKKPPTGVDRAKTAKFQDLLELTADGLWGEITDVWAIRMRTAARAHCGWGKQKVFAPFREDLVQRVIDVVPDNIWGPRSQAALVAWVKQLQRLLGVTADGWWGDGTEAAFIKFRAANLNKF